MCVMAMGDYAFTVTDNLPAFPYQHANPDPGIAAVLSAFLPHCSGEWPVDRLLNQKSRKVSLYSFLLYLVIQRDLLGIQRLLNSTEFSVNRLTALLDCHGLHKVRSDPDWDTFLIGLL